MAFFHSLCSQKVYLVISKLQGGISKTCEVVCDLVLCLVCEEELGIVVWENVKFEKPIPVCVLWVGFVLWKGYQISADPVIKLGLLTS